MRRTILAVVTAAATSAIADVAYQVARGTTPVFSYYALAISISVAAYVAIGIFASLARGGPPLALALCVAAEGVVARDLATGASLALATGLALVLRARLDPEPRSDRRAIADGVAVGLCLPMILILWRQMAGLQGILLNTAVTDGALIATGLLAFVAYDALRNRLAAWLPSPVPLTGLALIALFGVLPASIGSPRENLSQTPAAADDPRRPDVLVLVLDTVRADHLSVYGYARDTTPSLARLLAKHPGAVAYPMAYSPSNWTLPAHASLFTGTTPSRHGIHSGRSPSAFSYGPLVAEQTLAETMKRAGYATAGIFANPHLLRVAGADRGFDVHYKPRVLRRSALLGEKLRARLLPDSFAGDLKPYSDALDVNNAVLRFFEECGDAPCFAVANYMEAHQPYIPRPSHVGRFASVPVPRDDLVEEDQHSLDGYHEEIAGLDERLGELFVALEANGILERTWVFVTADHGEAFAEHGQDGHRSEVYDEQIRVPLLVFPPAGETIVAREDAVSLLDVTATVSAIAGQPPLGDGRDLRDPKLAEQPIQIEQFEHGEPTNPMRAVVLSGHKLIDRPGSGLELYDLTNDPRELTNLAGTRAEVTGRLRSFLPEVLAIGDADPLPPGTSRGVGAISPEDEAALRALGYVD